MSPARDIAAALCRIRHAEEVLRRQNDPDLHEVAKVIAAYRRGDAKTFEDTLGLRPGPGMRTARTRAIGSASCGLISTSEMRPCATFP